PDVPRRHLRRRDVTGAPARRPGEDEFHHKDTKGTTERHRGHPRCLCVSPIVPLVPLGENSSPQLSPNLFLFFALIESEGPTKRIDKCLRYEIRFARPPVEMPS